MAGLYHAIGLCVCGLHVCSISQLPFTQALTITFVSVCTYVCPSVFLSVYVQSARNDRVDSWRSFQTKVKTKKVKTLKPPKLKQETRTAQ